jgi:hypothetical protein
VAEEGVTGSEIAYSYEILDVQTYVHNGKKKKKVKKKKRRIGGTDYMSSRASQNSGALCCNVNSVAQTMHASPEKVYPINTTIEQAITVDQSLVTRQRVLINSK